MVKEAMSIENIEHGCAEPDFVGPGQELHSCDARVSIVNQACQQITREEAIEKMYYSRDQHRDNWERANRDMGRELLNGDFGDVVRSACDAIREESRAVKAGWDADAVNNGGEARWHDENGDRIHRERASWPERCR